MDNRPQKPDRSQSDRQPYYLEYFKSSIQPKSPPPQEEDNIETRTFSTRPLTQEEELFYDGLQNFEEDYDDPIDEYAALEEELSEDYESVYTEDGSGIVKEYIPAGTKDKEPARPSGRESYMQKRQARRTLLEKRMSLILAGVLALCFFGTAVMLLILPRPDKSKIEKRELAKFPTFTLESYFAGKFTSDIAYFYDDTVPGRDELKNMGSNFKALFGPPASEDSVVVVGNIKKAPKKPDTSSKPNNDGTVSGIGEGIQSADISAILAQAAGRNMQVDSSAPPPAENPFANAEEVDNTGAIMVVKQDGHYRGLEVFGGVKGETYAQGLNSLRSQISEDVKLWSMPAPLACEFYTPDSHREYVTSQSQCFDNTAALLDPGISSINICPALSQHASEPIYCRTDHHWQPLGAYYAAQAFASAAGTEFDDISAYEPVTIGDFVGSLYAFSQSASLQNDPEDFVYYKPKRSYEAVYYSTSFEFGWDDDDFFQEGKTGSDAYLVYLGGDETIVKATTDVQNGRKLLLIKDSYGNAMAPFLTGSFQQIYVADIRYLERNLVSFIRDMGITDVLFSVSAFSLVGENSENISNLISQNAGETVVDPHP